MFRQMTRPLPESCTVLTASSVEELLNDARRLSSSLKTDVLQHCADHVERLLLGRSTLRIGRV